MNIVFNIKNNIKRNKNIYILYVKIRIELIYLDYEPKNLPLVYFTLFMYYIITLLIYLYIYIYIYI